MLDNFDIQFDDEKEKENTIITRRAKIINFLFETRLGNFVFFFVTSFLAIQWLIWTMTFLVKTIFSFSVVNFLVFTILLAGGMGVIAVVKTEE